MRGDRDLVEGIARLAALASEPFDADELLTELCQIGGRALDVDGVGVMEAHHDGAWQGRTRYVHAQAHIREAEQLQEALQEGPCHDAVTGRDVVAIEDVRTMAARWAPFVASTLHAQMHSVLVAPLVSRDRVWGTLDLYRTIAGPWPPQDVAAARLLADVAVSYLVMARDRDQARAAQLELEHRSLHDGLTGLPNRTLLFNRIEHAITRSVRHRTTMVIAFIDLDEFKRINDTLGHVAGDHVLTEVARRLQSAVRAEDTVARLAGDEFVVLCTTVPSGPAHTDFTNLLAKRLQRAFLAPIIIGDTQRTISASIGISVTSSPPADTTVESLLHSADLAMYQAKAEPSSAVRIHRRL